MTQVKHDGLAIPGRVVLAHELPFHLGLCRIDPATRQVEGDGPAETVEPRVMQGLVALARASGAIVTRDELIERCWDGRIVSDDAINRVISRIRQIGARIGSKSFTVETITKVGYRLLIHAGVTEKPKLDRRTLIGVGAATGACLLGAGIWLRSSGGSVEAGRWTDQGDALLRDAAPLQAGVALAPLRKALEIEPENARALGLLALAEETRANNGGSPDAGATLRVAEQAAKAALERDPEEPHAKLALLDMSGASLEWLEWEKQLESLRSGAPANLHVLGSLSSFLQAAGQTSRSWVYNEQAAAAAPSSPTPQWRRALRLWTGGREAEALQLSERLLHLWPRHPMVWNARFMVLAFTGRLAAAAAMMNDSSAVSDSHPVRPEQWRPTFIALADPTSARIAEARRANLAAEQNNPGQAAYAAMTLSQLGELDAAFAVINALLLAKGPLVTRRSSAPHSFSANSPSWCRTQWLFMPPLGAVRGDPRFAVICNEIGLTKYWLAHRSGPDTSLPR
jgi:DNA-binding winged helix-turn-helix (wHTH) protein/tetratricopeptide (TPR) repeat protein